MLSFLDWLDTKGFWVAEAWDFETGKWAGPGWLELMEWERRILAHCLTPDAEGKFPYTTIIFSTTKKTGKSTIGAAVAQWAAEEFPPHTEIFVCANSQEQGEGRIGKDLKYHVERSGRYYPDKDGEDRDAKSTAWEIDYPNGTMVGILAQNYKSAAGSRHALVVWDELWGRDTEAGRRMWAELTPIPTVPVSLQFIATYAGFEVESKLLWELYLKGVGAEENKDGRGTKIPGLKDLPCWENERIFCFWDHENRMPWQTQEYLDQQLTSSGLRPSEYLRFHENRWVSTHEVFIPIEWWDEAAKAFKKDLLIWEDHPYRDFPIFLAIDASTKKDSTAVVGTVYDGTKGEVIEVIRRIWTPKKGELFSLQDTVGNFVLSVYNKYNVQKVVYDPTQMHEVMVGLTRAGVPMEEFKQTAVLMTEASQALFDLLQKRSYKTFPGDEARRHIQMAVAKSTDRGFRIIKDDQKRKHPIDYAVAAAMSVKAALDSGGVHSSEPIRIQSVFSDRTQWPMENAIRPSQEHLPFELRDDI